MKKVFLLSIFLVVCILLVTSAILALMPPEDMAKRNLEARVIVIGEVTETGAILLPKETPTTFPVERFFVLEVVHVVKGYEIITPGDQIKILSGPRPQFRENLARETPGSLPIKVEVGTVVVVYIDPYPYPNFYRPVAAGSSVITIGYPLPR